MCSKYPDLCWCAAVAAALLLYLLVEKKAAAGQEPQLQILSDVSI
jgi:hypothetical protein